MERNVMLPLRGSVQNVRGYNSDGPWQVIRVRAASNEVCHDADAAIIKSRGDIAAAVQSGYTKAVAIGETLTTELDALPSVITLSGEYAYLSDGDILGFQLDARRFRTLYRRSSAHNSFLVTERCNHYCLMCSQPPRDIDDRWILDEIKAALPLVDPQTKSFAFTGGEPLLEWRIFIEILGQLTCSP